MEPPTREAPPSTSPDQKVGVGFSGAKCCSHPKYDHQWLISIPPNLEVYFWAYRMGARIFLVCVVEGEWLLTGRKLRSK